MQKAIFTWHVFLTFLERHFDSTTGPGDVREPYSSPSFGPAKISPSKDGCRRRPYRSPLPTKHPQLDPRRKLRNFAALRWTSILMFCKPQLTQHCSVFIIVSQPICAKLYADSKPRNYKNMAMYIGCEFGSKMWSVIFGGLLFFIYQKGKTPIENESQKLFFI